MFAFSKDEQPSSKCYFTHSRTSSSNKNQPISKKRSFAVLKSHPFAHTVDLILPGPAYETIEQMFNVEPFVLGYARVIMSLNEIVTGDFFNHYIKTGNIFMLSEGRPTVDNVFSLRDGILKLELDRATYERCGLVGKPVPDGGRKHTKARYVVELNLRLPHMLHGKKGFDRIVWAFKNVLNYSVTWLFHDVQGKTGGPGPISKYHPIVKTVTPEVTRMNNVLVPPFKPAPALVFSQDAAELLEWLGLLSLRSARVNANDKIDPYLSRYEVPSLTAGGPDVVLASKNVTRVRWYGLANPYFLEMVGDFAKGVAKTDWTALSVCCFGGAAYSILNIGEDDSLIWECD